MDWKEVGQKIASAAPVLGGLLGGPAGAAVGGIVAATLGSGNDAVSVDAAIAANPDALMKLKELETTQATRFQELAIESEKNRLAAETAAFAAEVDDRKSARELAAKQPKDILRPALAIMLMLAVIGIIVAIFLPSSREILKDSVAISMISMVAGAILRDFGNVISFQFGTSRDTQKINADIAKFAMTPGDVTLYDSQKKVKE
ncbi:putative membrane protein [Burkholderia phage Maja]|uniref:Putative membrane protein n=1 Tax=Burkholderia phage Maja TaxID=2767571 RepID=A0A7S6R899_9CAUD|nr:putative membrane protein [Burkholderia phage Maja]